MILGLNKTFAGFRDCEKFGIGIGSIDISGWWETQKNIVGHQDYDSQ